MKTIILLIGLVFIASPAYAREVTLGWDPNTEPDLAHYTLYQADRAGDMTGPWISVKQVPAGQTTTILTVQDGKNFAWYLTACDETGNESRPSNMVELYDRTPPADPVNLHKPQPS